MDTLSKRIKLSILLIILAAFTIVCATSGGGGQDTSSQSDYEGPLTAMITEISGTVQVLKAAEGVYNDAVLAQELENSDQVLTYQDGRARIDLSTGTIIRLSPLSEFTFESMESTDEGILTRLRLEVGRLWVILNGGEVEVDTPSGLASVRGSYLHVWVRPDEDITEVTCLEGECTLGNDYGTVTLVAGQTAVISGVGLPPSSGKMSDEDVDDWLEENPEATLVLLELTATVAAGEGVNPNQNTAPTATPLAIKTQTPTITETAVACGPPADWVLHTVASGETLDSLAKAFQVSVADLQYANCRGESTAVVVGESLFVPNVATITPTPTNTATPTTVAPTNTPVPAAPTATIIPTNSPSVFNSPVGPDSTQITDPAFCSALYSITVTDADGVSEVKMIYSLDGSVPDWNSAVGAGDYKLLSSVGGNTYQATYSIPSYEALAGVVKYRFAVKDSSGVISYFPAAGAYSYTDTIFCGAPTNFSEWYGPDSTFPITVCQQDFGVTVDDLNGINAVEIVYKVKDSLGNVLTTGTEPLSLLSGTDTNGVWGVSGLSITTNTYTLPVTIIYQFKAEDLHGNFTTFSTSFSYEDNLGCP